ncbi:MAG: hypothetical protein OXB95_08970 [Rhodobacteraceae bacterium]|nr:hypothetical protein [Paracoccaceae bacterium]
MTLGFGFLIAAIPLAATVSGLAAARRGLKRLEDTVFVNLRLLSTVAATGAALGLAAAWPPASEDGWALIRIAPTVFLCTLMLTVASVDWQTAWAPRELMIPICLLAGVVAFDDACLSTVTLTIGITAGLLLLLASTLFWKIQCAVRLPILPPADFIALCMPALLFGLRLSSLLCYAALACMLLAIGQFRLLAALAGSRRARNVSLAPMGPGNCRSVALCALAFPLVVASMLTRQSLQVG